MAVTGVTKVGAGGGPGAAQLQSGSDTYIDDHCQAIRDIFGPGAYVRIDAPCSIKSTAPFYTIDWSQVDRLCYFIRKHGLVALITTHVRSHATTPDPSLCPAVVGGVMPTLVNFGGDVALRYKLGGPFDGMTSLTYTDPVTHQAHTVNPSTAGTWLQPDYETHNEANSIGSMGGYLDPNRVGGGFPDKVYLLHRDTAAAIYANDPNAYVCGIVSGGIEVTVGINGPYIKPLLDYASGVTVNGKTLSRPAVTTTSLITWPVESHGGTIDVSDASKILAGAGRIQVDGRIVKWRGKSGNTLQNCTTISGSTSGTSASGKSVEYSSLPLYMDECTVHCYPTADPATMTAPARGAIQTLATLKSELSNHAGGDQINYGVDEGFISGSDRWTAYQTKYNGIQAGGKVTEVRWRSAADKTIAGVVHTASQGNQDVWTGHLLDVVDAHNSGGGRCVRLIPHMILDQLVAGDSSGWPIYQEGRGAEERPAGTRIVAATATGNPRTGAWGSPTWKPVADVYYQRLGPTSSGAPSNTALPTISDTTPGLDETLTITRGTYSGSPAPTIVGQLQRQTSSGWEDIPGASSSSATWTYGPVVSADVDCPLRVVEVATNTHGTANATSAATAPVGEPPQEQSAPAIDNTTPQVGDTLTGDDGTYTRSPTALHRQWYRDATQITGATGTQYQVLTADSGHTIKYGVTPENEYGLGTQVFSPATSTVTTPTGRPTVQQRPTLDTQSPVVGQQVTAIPGVYGGAPTPTKSWQRKDRAGTITTISGPTGDTYAPAPADLDYRLRQAVLLTNGAGTRVTHTPWTDRVVDAPPPPPNIITKTHHWVFTLCNRAGQLIDRFGDDLQGRKLSFGDSIAAVCTLDLPTTSTILETLLDDALQPFRIKAYRDGVLRFHGEAWLVTETVQTAPGRVEILAVDALQNLTNRVFAGNGDVPITDSPAGTMIHIVNLIQTSGDLAHTAGIQSGSVSGTAPAQKQVWQAGSMGLASLQSLMSSYPGCCFLVTPIEGTTVQETARTAGRPPVTVELMGRLDTFEQPFGAKTAAVFSIGHGQDNCSQIQRVRDRRLLVNQSFCRSAGSSGKTDTKYFEAYNGPSVDQHGAIDAYQSPSSNVTSLGQVQALARAAILARIPRAYTLTPTTSAPALWDDFQIGDQVLVTALQDEINITELQRVYQAEVTIDQDGNETLSSLTVGAVPAAS